MFAKKQRNKECVSRLHWLHCVTNAGCVWGYGSCCAWWGNRGKKTVSFCSDTFLGMKKKIFYGLFLMNAGKIGNFSGNLCEAFGAKISFEKLFPCWDISGWQDTPHNTWVKFDTNIWNQYLIHISPNIWPCHSISNVSVLYPPNPRGSDNMYIMCTIQYTYGSVTSSCNVQWNETGKIHKYQYDINMIFSGSLLERVKMFQNC